MKTFKKRWFLISSGSLIVIWTVLIVAFFQFYSDAIEFGESETSNVMQVLLIIKYRGPELIRILIGGFLAITLSLYNLLIMYFKLKGTDKANKKEKIQFILSTIILFVLILSISINVLGLIWLGLTLLSFSIVYVSYVVARNTIGRSIRIKEEVLGEHGPFKDKQELKEYTKELTEEHDLSNLTEDIFENEEGIFVRYTN